MDVTNPTFSLNNLIQVGVQQHIDDCEEIIEIANKELKVDRKLKDISQVWKGLILLYTPYKDTEIKLVKVSVNSYFISLLIVALPGSVNSYYISLVFR